MSAEEKTEEPTDHKLREARKKGDVPASRELTGDVAFLVLVLALWLAWDPLLARVRAIPETALGWVSGRGPMPTPGEQIEVLAAAMMWILLPVFGLVTATAMLTAGLQVRGVFSLEPLQLKFDRLNPGQGLQRLFSTQQAMELVKMLLKLGAIGACLWAVLNAFVGPMVEGLRMGSVQAAAIDGQALRSLFGRAALVYLVLGVVDYAHQRFEHRKRNKMSKSEVQREYKDQEGDPHLKGELKSRRRELVESPIPPGVGSAQVLVTNPTHFAVALCYRPGQVPLPVVVAKGEDGDAFELRRQAERRRIPILERPPLARSLFAQVAVGGTIRAEHIEAVAEVFRWLASLKRSG